jgi:peroxiredoxin
VLGDGRRVRCGTDAGGEKRLLNGIGATIGTRHALVMMIGNSAKRHIRSLRAVQAPLALRGAQGTSIANIGAPDPRRRFANSLVGRTIPPGLRLTSFVGETVEPRRDTAPAVVVYFYPGTAYSPDGGSDTTSADVAQHRAFDRHHDDFVAHSLRAIGVSSASERALRTSVFENRLGHHDLWSDPKLELAQALELPTFELAGEGGYRRLTMIVLGGSITKVFFPIESPERSAAQAIWWLKATGR